MQNAKLRYECFASVRTVGAIHESPAKAPSGSSEAKPRALNECPVDIQIPRCIPEGYIAK